MQVNGTSNCNCWDGSETSIPSTMLLGQQTPQEMLSPFTGMYFLRYTNLLISKKMCQKVTKNYLIN